MVVGFNHNVMYKGEMFHIQTEDSGINNPHIITLLYRGGNIISSKKTSYADIVKMENLDQVVEDLMKEQHKDMLRRLKSGEFDAKLVQGGIIPPPPLPTQEAPAPVSPPPAPPAAAPPAEPDSFLSIQPTTAAKPKEQSLDDIIFDFLTAGDKK